MKVINGFLERFKHLKAPERSVRAAIIESIKDIIGVSIDDDSIKVGLNGILNISTNSSIRCAIFENKQNIIKRVNNILGKDQVKDIR
ncbi:MAG: hypothetical protein LRZ97_00610 [Candidatus Pacebacteria bacterium]|nr:hypothetical protein [Candidatus Paceibacterota bacterium]